MSRFLKCVFSAALIFVLCLSVFAGIGEEAKGKEIVIVNRTGFSIAEFYLTYESNPTLGPLRNRTWIKNGESVVFSLTAEDLEISAWKARIGVSRGGKVVYSTFNNVDLAPMLESGYANFIPEEEGSVKFLFEATKKEFFYLSNTTDFTIKEIYLMPTDSGMDSENRLEKPLMSGELIKISLSYEEVKQETTWNLRLGVEEDGTITYFTLQNFPLEKLTGCECVILKPYKDSMSFYYSKEPLEV